MKAITSDFKWFPVVCGVLALLVFAGCETSPQYRKGPPPPGMAAPGSYGSPAAAREALSADASSRMMSPAPDRRPGLGTEWGETRVSTVSDTSFHRQNGSRPSGTARLFYNDKAGLERMMRYENNKRRVYGMREGASGLIAWGIEGESGSLLRTYEAGGQLFVEGAKGSRYSIVAKNTSNRRIEVVFSVDGLDVLDGRAASYGKRGYVLGPRQKIEVDGFRKSQSEVAAFRFSSVQNSYAQLKHGDTRNVGVIGVAVFEDRYSYARPPHDRPGDGGRRRVADPFPGRFADAP